MTVHPEHKKAFHRYNEMPISSNFNPVFLKHS